jgi:hypothetical protein
MFVVWLNAMHLDVRAWICLLAMGHHMTSEGNANEIWLARYFVGLCLIAMCEPSHHAMLHAQPSCYCPT